MTDRIVQLKHPLKEKEIFVFGSNLSGIHGKGAALWAKRIHGAINGRGQGIQGNSYAIPTKGHYVKGRFDKLTLTQIQIYVDLFTDFVLSHPDMSFILTPIGCGLAGFTPEQIAPLFERLWQARVTNIHFPPEFIKILENKT